MPEGGVRNIKYGHMAEFGNNPLPAHSSFGYVVFATREFQQIHDKLQIKFILARRDELRASLDC